MSQGQPYKPSFNPDREIFHITYSPSGGAGTIAKKLAETQAGLGFKSRLVTSSLGSVSQVPATHPVVSLAALLDQVVLAKPDRGLVSLLRSRISTITQKIFEEGAVVNLHWLPGAVADSMLQLDKTSNTSLFWTLHDMRPLTGACHFTQGCFGFQEGCSSCPAIKKLFRKSVEVSLSRKRLALADSNITFVAPSHGMLAAFNMSALSKSARGVMIPNPLSFKNDLVGSSDVEKVSGNCIFIAANVEEKRKGLEHVLSWWKTEKPPSLGKLFIVGAGSERYSLPTLEIFGVGSLPADGVKELLEQTSVLLFGSSEDNAPGVVSEALAYGHRIVCFDLQMLDWLVQDGVPAIHFSALKSARGSLGPIDRVAIESFLASRDPDAVALKYIDAYASS